MAVPAYPKMRFDMSKVQHAAVCLIVLAGFGGIEDKRAAAEQAAEADRQQFAHEILKETGVRGGLVVHLGCGDGRLTAELGAGEAFCVQGLDGNAEQVEAARAHVRSLGRYGRVSIERLTGTELPYVDNSVNLIVVSGPSTVNRDEVLRVLCPGGTAVFTTNGGQRTNSLSPARATSTSGHITSTMRATMRSPATPWWARPATCSGSAVPTGRGTTTTWRA